MTKQYKSDAFEAIHSLMSDLHQGGAISDEKMRHYDSMCLVPVEEMSAQEISDIRKKENLSQSVFAFYLNVSKNSVSAWERGIKKPSGAALKLLTLVRQKGIDAIV